MEKLYGEFVRCIINDNDSIAEFSYQWICSIVVKFSSVVKLNFLFPIKFLAKPSRLFMHFFPENSPPSKN